MNSPEYARDRYVQSSEFAGWACSPLVADASARKYFRLTDGNGRTAILMDAAAQPASQAEAFIKVANHLCGIGLSAPEIYDSAPEQGFMVIEDFGDALFCDVLIADPRLETAIYSTAVDAIVAVQNAPLPNCPVMSATILAEMTDVAFQFYGLRPDSELAPLLGSVFQVLSGEVALSLRDVHSQNLMWLPDRTGLARVGFLDFQDAVITHPIYDLVSLLQDARRDVSKDVTEKMIDRYIDMTGYDRQTTLHAYSLISVQRNLRILGIFARLARLEGKTGYLPMIPRVWAHLLTGLYHPDLGDLRHRILSVLPEPTDAHLARLARA